MTCVQFSGAEIYLMARLRSFAGFGSRCLVLAALLPATAYAQNPGMLSPNYGGVPSVQSAPQAPALPSPVVPRQVPAPSQVSPQSGFQPLQAPAPGGTPQVGTPAPVPQMANPGAVVPSDGQQPVPQQQALPKAKPKPKAPPTPPRETALSDDPTPSFQPETFFTTAKASELYARIVDAGGWPKVPGNLSPGAKGKGVAALRRRLAVEGDLDGSAGDGETWDEALTAGVKKFQFRMGLKRSGVVAGATLRALNIPANVRFRQLASSAQRIAGSTFSFADRYVVVNIPSATVETIENGRIVRRYIAVVGDVDHRSPEVSTRIQNVNLNPTWTVPTSIIKNEIIPKMRKDPGYLSRAKIRILDGQGNQIDPKSVNWQSERAVNYTLRQDSGAGNSLGNIRINMPNKMAVYMHDTPSKRHFGADYRFLSHGCVRVEGVHSLAEWLLQGSPGPSGAWTKDSILAKIGEGERYDVKLVKSVPVIWVYLTGWASADGTVHFRDDVYNVDTVGGDAQVRADAR